MHKDSLIKGFKDGVPIGLAYFAVAFSLGIVASNAGMSAFEGFLTSFLVNASAGESAGFTAIKETVPYFEMVLITIVANMRYILMSCSMSQHFSSKTSLIHRLLLGFYLTDEYFALAISQDEIDPYYSYGAILFASPMWAIGTALGIIMGNILPSRIVSALSVALYGMFIAIVVPPAKKDKAIAVCVVASFLLSFLLNRFTSLSSSFIVIILTIIISATAAVIFPRKKEETNE